MSLLRVILRLDALPAPAMGWQVRVSPPDGAEFSAHKVAKVPVGPGAGPFAPSHVPCAWTPDGAPAALAPAEVQALAQACSRIVRRQAQGDDIRRVGRGLFDALLGQAFWRDTVQPMAKDAQMIELALLWPQNDPVLHGLNWELLHDEQGFLSNGFLADGRRTRVVITRIVRRSAGAVAAFSPSRRVPRLLFVVGCRLNDPAVRAGAEYLGLLRRLEQGTVGKGPAGRALTTKVLIEATPKRLAAAVQEFRPDLIHYVGHGDFLNGGPVVRFEPDDPIPGAQVQPEDKFRTGPQLARLLTWTPTEEGAPDRPRVVILSACLTGVALPAPGAPSLSADGLAPLAAQLVAEGIPAVIGMAGRVTDVACRLFTGYFGEAVLFGKPLALAVEAGRRAGFRDGHDPYLHPDWAFPTIHLDAEAPPDYSPTAPPADDAEEQQLRRFVSNLRVEREPVFAARFEHLDSTYRSWISDGRSALVLVGPAKCGKTRLLKELAAQAARDGHIPVLAVPEENQVVSTLRGLGELLYDSLRRTCSSLALKLGDKAELPKLLQRAPYEENALGTPAGSNGVPEPDVNQLLAALRLDLLRLAELARAQHPRVNAAGGQPVLLLGRLERWDPDRFLPALRDGGLERLTVSGFGYGDDDGTVLRVAISFRSHSGPWEGLLQKLGEGGEPDWMRRRTLDYLPAGDDFEAAARLLLHAPNFAGTWLQDDEKVPYVLNPYSDVARLGLATKRLRDWTKQQLPGSFRTEQFAMWLQSARDLGVLQPASDEDLLRQYRPWQ